MKKTIRKLGNLSNIHNLREAQRRELMWLIIPAALVAAVGFLIAYHFVEPAPPKRIAITTASQTGAYFANGQRYAEILKRSGVTLDVKTSAGSVENVKRLKDPANEYQVALLQGGTTNSAESPGIVSLGRVYLEPMWVFYRDDRVLGRLSELKGKRVIVGPEGSGTRMLAMQLLKANGISDANTSFIPLAGAQALEAITGGRADAAFFTSAVNAPQIQQLIRTPDLKLMSFEQADAYTRLFPYLSKITLPKGAIDLVERVPAQDVDLVAPVAALVARSDLHPALVGLLTEAAKEVHAPGGMFNRIGEFPRATDPELEMSADAERIHRFGPPFLQRYLPFWLATFLERMKVMALPIATILIPLIKLVPAIFRWRARQRLLYWYGQLKALESRIVVDPVAQIGQHRIDFERIENAVESTPIPLAFSDQYYTLRSAIDLVGQRLDSIEIPPRTA